MNETRLHTGQTAGSSAPQLVNAPNKASLSFRLGTAHQFFGEMLESLLQEEVPDMNGNLHAPFSGANQNPSLNWAVALAEAWSNVGDILSFYQERLVNEGYLRTAEDPTSIKYLIESLGIRRGASAVPISLNVNDEVSYASTTLDPGAAATVAMIFNVTNDAGLPDNILVPSASQLRHHPADGSLPQVFETGQAALMRRSWNQIQVASYQPSPVTIATLNTSSLGLKIDGVSTGLRPGMLILILGTLPSGKSGWCLRIIESIEINRALRFTQIVWPLPQQDYDSELPSATELSAIKVYSFAKRYTVFGADAPRPSSLPTKQRMTLPFTGGVLVKKANIPWLDCNNGLPQGSVQALWLSKANVIYLATDKGVFTTNLTMPHPWQGINVGIGARALFCFAEDAQGYIYAGSSAGGVYRSCGSQDGWDNLAGGIVLTTQNGKQVVVKTSLPNAIVRKLQFAAAAPAQIGTQVVIALCDTRLWVNRLDGNGWTNIEVWPSTTQTSADQRIRDFLMEKNQLVVLCEKSLSFVTWTGISFWQEIETDVISLGEAVVSSGIQGLLTKIWNWVTGKSKPSSSNEAPDSSNISFQGKPNVKSIRLSATAHSIIRLPTAVNGISLMATTDNGPILINENKDDVIPVTMGLPQDSLAAVNLIPGQANGGPLAYITISNEIYGFDVEGGPSWKVVPQSPPTAPPQMIAASGSTLVVSTPPQLATEWPQFELNDQILDINATLGSVAPDGYCVALDSVQKFASLNRIKDACPMEMNAFDKQGKATRISFQTETLLPVGTALSEFGRRNTVVYIQSKELPVYSAPKLCPAPPVQGSAIELTIRDDELAPMSLPEVEKTAGVGTSDQKALPPPIQRNPFYSALFPSDLSTALAQPPPMPKGLSSAPDPSSLRPIVVSGRPARSLLAPSMGVSRLCPTTGKMDLSVVGGSLPNRDVVGLAVNANALLAAAKQDGVYCWTGGQSWQCDSNGIGKNEEVLAVATDGSKDYALTSQQLYWRNSHPGAIWEKRADSGWNGKPAVLSITADNFIMVGATDGLYGLSPGANCWLPLNGGEFKDQGCVTALLPVSNGAMLLAVQNMGIFIGSPQTSNWRFWSQGLTHLNICTLTWDGENRVLAGAADGGLFHAEIGQDWRKAGNGAPEEKSSALLYLPRVGWLAGTNGAGLHICNPDFTCWSSIPCGTSNIFSSLVLDPKTLTVFVGTLAGTTIGNANGEKPILVSRMVTLPLAMAPLFDQEILSSSTVKSLSDAGLSLPDDGVITTVSPGVFWILSGRSAANAPLIATVSPEGIDVGTPSSIPKIMAAIFLSDGSAELTLKSADSGTGSLTLSPDQFQFWSSDPQDSITSLVGMIQDNLPSHDGNHSILTLAQPLNGVLDAATAVVSGNVAMSSQGMSVAEILGSGNSSQVCQSFTLKQAPLTFLRSPAPQNRQSTLSVTVDGIPWRECQNLSLCGSTDQAYSVSIDEIGAATIHFGNGVNGARLSSGIQNVKAYYRSGMGPVGDLQDGIIIFLAAVVGLAKSLKGVLVEPPIPPQTTKIEQSGSPFAGQGHGRLITTDDYECMITKTPDVVAAQACHYMAEGQSCLYITIVPADQSSVDPQLIPQIEQAILAAQAAPPKRFQIATFKPLYVVVSVTVWTSENDMDAVRQSVQNAVGSLLAYGNRKLAAGLNSSAIISAAQSVPGVQGISLDSFHLKNFTPCVADRLTAKAAHWDGKHRRMNPAEMLVLDPQGNGLTVLTLAHPSLSIKAQP